VRLVARFVLSARVVTAMFAVALYAGALTLIRRGLMPAWAYC